MSNLENKKKYEIIEGGGSIAFNFFIAVIKFFVFLYTQSISVLADAVHSLSDIFTSVMVIVSAYISTKKADKEHPFGHGRAESISSFVIAFFIILTGIEFLQVSIKRIIHPVAIKWNGLFFVIISITIGIKLGNVLFAYILNKKVPSNTIEADLWHHLTDVFSTFVVLIGMLLIKWNVRYADGVAGVIVSFIVIGVGISLVKDALSPLLGQAPSIEFLNRIRNIAKSVDNRIYNVHDIIVNNYGHNNIISLHLELPDSLSMLDGHEIAERVEEQLSEKLEATAVVHIDPINRAHPFYNKIEKLITIFISRHSSLKSYHDLRIIGKEKFFNVLFDLVPDSEQAYDEEQLIKEIETYLRSNCKNIHSIGVKIEKLFSY